jgi:ABC-type uncharacterized transport system involved in gliding motility auxiliary subunit
MKYIPPIAITFFALASLAIAQERPPAQVPTDTNSTYDPRVAPETNDSRVAPINGTGDESKPASDGSNASGSTNSNATGNSSSSGSSGPSATGDQVTGGVQGEVSNMCWAQATA